MKNLYTAVLLALSLTTFSQDLRAIYNDGVASYKEGDFSAFLMAMKKADSLSPDHPTITYQLAKANARMDYSARALELLQKSVLMNTGFDPEKEEDFKALDLSGIVALKNELNQAIEGSEVAITNSEKDLHPESVAYDPKSGHFFLNSVRKGKILRYSPQDDKFEEFATGRWAVMGMRVHGKYLWACEVATSEHESFEEINEGKTALLKYNIKTGELEDRYELEGGHWFGDLILNKKGVPFISDSKQPIIYTLMKNEVTVYKDFSNDLFNLQGLAFSEGFDRLFIADYKIGIHVFDTKTMELTKLQHGDEMITKGVDGLYFYAGSLITIQNGVRPFRVSRFKLSADAKSIESVEYLDKAIPALDEPTLGVIVGTDFYYVANSPWGAYKDGKLETKELGDNQVRKIKLK